MNQNKREPSKQELHEYACELRDDLDSFVALRFTHRVSLIVVPQLIICSVEKCGGVRSPSPVQVEEGGQAERVTLATLLAEQSTSDMKKAGRWRQRRSGMLVFDGPRILLYKSPWLRNWSHQQAARDGVMIIGELLAPFCSTES